MQSKKRHAAKMGPPRKRKKSAPEPHELRRGLRGDAALEQLVAIAADLLPIAAGQARKGRARLLSVVSRILLSKKRVEILTTLNESDIRAAFQAGRATAQLGDGIRSGRTQWQDKEGPWTPERQANAEAKFNDSLTRREDSGVRQTEALEEPGA